MIVATSKLNQKFINSFFFNIFDVFVPIPFILFKSFNKYSYLFILVKKLYYIKYMSLKIEELKKKIIYRSSYRGNKEMDIILKSFISEIYR